MYRRYSQFICICELLQSCLPLLDRPDKDSCTIDERLNIPPITEFFGEGSFDHPFEKSWETFLTNNGNLSTGLQHAWSHLQSNFQDVATSEQLADVGLLNNRSIERTGFYPDG